MIFVTQKGPSTHIIDVKSCIEKWNATIVTEELS